MRSPAPSLRLSLSPSLLLFHSLSLLLGLAAPLAAQDEAEEESPYLSGLVARYTAGEAAATRIDESISFDWAEDPPDPRLAPLPFRAQWSGRLWTQVAGAYRLAVYAEGGNCRIRLGEREILAGQATAPRWMVSEPIDLEFDRHPLAVTFEKAGARAQLKLFWSGPGFVLEPIPARYLMHDRQATASLQFERGRRLARALRCGGCHGASAGRPELAAPALDKLAGNLHPAWLVDWLSEAPAAGQTGKIVRRMPHFGLTRQEAIDVAASLLNRAKVEEANPQKGQALAEDRGQVKKQKSKGKKKDGPPLPSAEQGEQLFTTLGCLACHQHGELGESGLFGGGDLTKIAQKRPTEFFARWLADPASLIRHHRMPVFELTADERTSLSLWLARQGTVKQPAATSLAGDPAAGQRLVERLRCAACHSLTNDKEQTQPALASLSEASRWARSCAGQADAKSVRPGFRLAAVDQAALRVYYSAGVNSQPVAEPARGRDLLVELNCLACHVREGIDRATNSLPATLQEKLPAVVALHDSLGKQVPAMTPPALNCVGDKLHDAALADAILRKGQPHRPYLLVRMPKYALSDAQTTALTNYFTTTDRIPSGAGLQPASSTAGKMPAPQLVAAGPRLVTTDGFGCTSCHQVGSVLPDKAPASARGPSLSLLEKRIRRQWFDRWCANPARIVPRMEMPSVQIPVRGVLGDNVADQLAAVWHILNTPGFEPPEPNPVRVLRLSGVPERKDQPIVLHDVIKSGDKTYLFPLVIGLPNRHNVLFDLETNRLAAWWLGDTARQRTKGKSWYWEAGAAPIFETSHEEDELTLTVGGQVLTPTKSRQFTATLADIDELGPSTQVHYSSEFTAKTGASSRESARYSFSQSWSPQPLDFQSDRTTFRRVIQFEDLPDGSQVTLRLVPSRMAKQCQWNPDSRELLFLGEPQFHIRLTRPQEANWSRDGLLTVPAGRRESVSLEYVSAVPSDQVLVPPIPVLPAEARSVSIAPGFIATKHPLPDDIMPSALTFRAQGRLVFATLKGQVFVATDTDSDGLFDKLHLAADGLPTPYGIHCDRFWMNDVERGEPIDVLAKDGLWRLMPWEHEWRVAKRYLLASGWGVTDDYHDWAVGLAKGKQGEYYMALPCQQDDRGQPAAKNRGQLLKLIPRRTVPDDPRLPELFDIEVLSSGHRFPMGLARNRDGELFVTDNQGNYNPFNELNHVRPGAHFGFINANEMDRGYKPPRYDRPAIDIPHPWTRSVNGICFLDTPPPLREQGQMSVFGPLEGHLIGCEYDTRQLIRMTLQKVGDTYQGAAYPLSIAPENVEDGLLGPIVCAVSPRGELYVGNIRDSGWGAGNNVGDIVRIKIEPDKLPCGIAEVRATPSGFTLDFVRPVDRSKAADAANYSIASYRREATPAYGGPNLDRRIEKIDAIEVSADGQRVTLGLSGLRAGFVYEFQLRPLIRGKELFHPAEAHYTLNRIPEASP